VNSKKLLLASKTAQPIKNGSKGLKYFIESQIIGVIVSMVYKLDLS
jgi:hypothetical protein